MRGITDNYHHFKQKLCHKYSLVGFEPSGTVAQCLGLQDIWDLLGPQGSSDTSGMTLRHAGTLLACWHTCWHSRQTHGIQTNDDHTALSIWYTSDSQAGVVRLISQVDAVYDVCRSEPEHSETGPTL